MPSEKRRMHSFSGRHNETPNGMQPTFSGRHPIFFVISDIYRVDMEIAEVRTDIARSQLDPVTLRHSKLQ